MQVLNRYTIAKLAKGKTESQEFSQNHIDPLLLKLHLTLEVTNFVVAMILLQV